MSTPLESGLPTPLRPALRPDGEDPTSPKSGPAKVVSIAEPEESPLSSPDDLTRIKQFPAGVASKRMTGRPQIASNSSSRLSLVSQNSVDDPNMSSEASETPHYHSEGRHHHKYHHDKLLLQVTEWLEAEKAKMAGRKSSKRASKEYEPTILEQEANGSTTSRPRTSSQSSDSSALSLERLQRILEDNMQAIKHDAVPATPSSLIQKRPTHGGVRRRSSAWKLGGFGSSDTEYQDGDVIVPSCDVVLDNSKTMSYSGGTVDSSSDTPTLNANKRVEKERKPWLVFKNEIVRLAHTLRLKGWRRVPLERGGDIEVERLSGALTNAVYVVSPPEDLPLSSNSTSSSVAHKQKPPPKLLLRIYGPQVEHLIDRENELGILRRLARKKIGPRLLGTFRNGRFEEFFNAQTLTAADLRVEDTSKQIAKRMRELHEGIDLLEREREEGPFVMRNWDKWVERCEEVISFLDKQIISGQKGRGEAWRERGLVCGVEWPLFKAAIDKYRKWLYEYYASKGGIGRKLVFAHNDTQYGNILRLIPEQPTLGTAPSPLLLPQNTHKQLVVIDFEYASANTPGLEFANHFTEWCYNYHDTAKPWACNTENYPTLAEQRRFVRSYVNHRPQFNPRASATPKMAAMDGLAKGSISEFLLDSRTPGGSAMSLVESSYAEDEAKREKQAEREVEDLLKEAHIWRVANSAQWVAWGIVQAKIPELDEKTILPEADVTEEPTSMQLNGPAIPTPGHDTSKETQGLDGLVAEMSLQGDSAKEADQPDGAEDEFDYLAYAQERAMFFWGDVVSLGLVKKEELPGSLLGRLKFVEY